MGELSNLTPREWAAQIWCRPENGHRQMDPVFAESIAAAAEVLMKERDAWIRDARRYCQNADYWRDRAEKAEALSDAAEQPPKARPVPDTGQAR